MNRRSFFKVVTGFVVGIFATSVEGKKFSSSCGPVICASTEKSVPPIELPNKSCILYRNWEYLFDVEDWKELTIVRLTIGRRTVSRMEDKEIFWTNDIVRKGILDSMISETIKV